MASTEDEVNDPLEEEENIRRTHRTNLRCLLKKLLLNKKWAEASGVLSVLLKASRRETSVHRNRKKYYAAMELMQHIMKSKNLDHDKYIKNIYNMWMMKLRRKSSDSATGLDVQLEFIVYCLRHGNLKDAYEAVMSVRQILSFDKHPMANFVVGLAYFESWYSAIPEDMKITKLWEFSSSSSINDDTMDSPSSEMEDTSDGNVAVLHQSSSLGSDSSNTSFGKEKILQSGTSPPPQAAASTSFYLNFGENEGFLFPDQGDDIPISSIFYTGGKLPPWLLPLRLPVPDSSSTANEDLESFLHRHRDLINHENYKNSVKFLRAALHSEPPLLDSFVPLIQVLLMGDHVEEAISEVEKFSSHSTEVSAVDHLKLKATIFEHFDIIKDRENAEQQQQQLSTRLEKVLDKDPTCRYTLNKLVRMHEMGVYDTERLAEMLSLHLDATYAGSKTWQDLAACLLKLTKCVYTEMSTECSSDSGGGGSSSSNRIPAIFTENPEKESNWRLRCRWWLTRHYGAKRLESEIGAGEMELVTFKAAVATHLYGRQLKYVGKVTEYLQRGNNVEMLCVLQKHIKNSVGFYLAYN